tara:strand:+ start:41 stop:226 length:186 start_codon:yes stop_codon:yes gene_type:complete
MGQPEARSGAERRSLRRASCWLKAEPACFPLGVGIALLALVFVGAGLFIDPIQTTSAGRGF